MSLPVFWRESLPEAGGDRVLLDGSEAHHAAVVRRVAVGERVRVTDGRGTYVEGPAVVVGRQTVEVAVERRGADTAPSLRLTVVQAVPKGDRARPAVEALVEVGVDRVVPWAAERSQVRMGGERGERLAARWRAWAFEASKQARRSWFCEVGDVASTGGVAGLLGAAEVGLVLHVGAVDPLGAVPLPRTGTVLLVVGPEGGMGPDELAALGVRAPTGAMRLSPPGFASRIAPVDDTGDSAGGGPGDGSVDGPGDGSVRLVRLGDTVLRTSTAGAVAAGVVLAATRWR